MDICPNCGEPIEEDAQACPHCGSDDETGWNPDVEYYSLELPEDDDYGLGGPGDPGAGDGDRVGWTDFALLGLSMVLATVAGWSTYGWTGLVPTLFLCLCALVYLAGTRQPA